jgi:hypothetical protein
MALAGALLGAASLWAHHGLAAFDTTHTVKMQGTVTDIQWINPHAFIFADLKTVQGFPAKDGSPYMSLGRIWLSNGQSLEGKP